MRVLDVPEKTGTVLEHLARFTGQEGGIGAVLEDAVKVYRYLLARQAEGKTIAVLLSEDVKRLEEGQRFSGERECLVEMVLLDQREAAKDYLLEEIGGVVAG